MITAVLVVALAVGSADASLPSPQTAQIVDARVERTRTVLATFADDARARRYTLAAGAGAVAAGMIGAGITYVTVANVDPALAAQDHIDTVNGGLVIAAAALVPAVVAGGWLLFSSDDERHLDDFNAGVSRAAIVDETMAALAKDSTEGDAAPVVGGVALIGTGLGSAGLGALFLLLPHVASVKAGPVSHATGAELIGVGVSSLGAGATLFFAGGSHAAIELTLLKPLPALPAPTATVAASE